MIYIWFFAEFLFLFLLSRLLSRTISQFFYHFSRSQKVTIYAVAILFFPGVVIHELSHWLMAQILFVPTGKVEFLPVLRGSELKLGSVAVAQTDPIRRAIIGVAPFVIGAAILLVLLFFYQQIVFIPERLRIVFLGYFIFEIGNTMFSSKKDLEGTVELGLTLIIIGIVLYFLGVRLPDRLIVFFLAGKVTSLISKADYLLLFPIAIDLVLICGFRIFRRR